MRSQVPGLDLLNCPGYAPPSASVRFDRGTETFELVLQQRLEAGEQLTIDYGDPTPHRLLRLYGFLPGDGGVGGDGGGGAGGKVEVEAADAPTAPTASASASLDLDLDLDLPDLDLAARHEEALLHLPGAQPLPLRWEEEARAGAAGGGVAGVAGAAGAAGGRTVRLPVEGAPPHVLHDLVRALDAQLARQAEGEAGGDAVLQTAGDSAADGAARRWARLCARLRAIERPLLLAAQRQLLSTLYEPPDAGVVR
eukprot:scaffold132431_cov60-Phaeocystis_antarctica.AAC.1